MIKRLFAGNRPDLILLHAPSVYDFRTRPILFGPVSDVVPSTPVFEMYPLGFLTMLQRLQQDGFRVRIVNIALKMLSRRRFDPEAFIRRLRPAAFGIDLHWMVHAQGALKLARICKKVHPEIPVVFGGLSSSFYHEELIAYPQVDYVLRGDSVEAPLSALVGTIRDGGDYSAIPNLTWKQDGTVRVNPLSHVPDSLDDLSFDYRAVMRSTFRAALFNFDLLGHIPFKQWPRYPIVAALTCRGCVHNCIICGGSRDAYRRICGREKPAYRDLERIAAEIKLIAGYSSAPVIILGDLLQGGRERALAFVETLRTISVKNHLAFEFFAPPPDDIIDAIADAVPNYNIQISPESHDEEVRAAFGRNYDNASLERFIAHALDRNCRRIDVFFMIGLPRQTPASVTATVAYCRHLLTTLAQGAHRGRLRPFISPLAPFLDPGSNAFMNPEKYGYRLLRRTLAEHVEALLEPSWKYTLNYETEWMTRDEIASGTYAAALDLNGLKREFGLISDRDADAVDRRIRSEQALMHAIDDLKLQGNGKVEPRELARVLKDFEGLSAATLCPKREMNWPKRLLGFNPFRIARSLLGSSVPGGQGKQV